MKKNQTHRPYQSYSEIVLMSIFDTPEKDVSNFNRKVYKINARTPLIKSSLTLFSCLIHAIYNRVHRAKNKRLILR